MDSHFLLSHEVCRGLHGPTNQDPSQTGSKWFCTVKTPWVPGLCVNVSNTWVDPSWLGVSSIMRAIIIISEEKIVLRRDREYKCRKNDMYFYSWFMLRYGAASVGALSLFCLGWPHFVSDLIILRSLFSKINSFSHRVWVSFPTGPFQDPYRPVIKCY